MNQIIQILSGLSLTHWIILAAGYGISVAVSAVLFWRWFLRREFRLYRNLKRPVMVITPTDKHNVQIPGKDMRIEIDLLVRNGFLKIHNGLTDYRAFNPNTRHCVVVLGYDPKMSGMDDVLTKVKNLQIPLIVYTFGENNALSAEHRQKFASYPLTIFANFQLTLINHIFSTLAVYPYDKKRD